MGCDTQHCSMKVAGSAVQFNRSLACITRMRVFIFFLFLSCAAYSGTRTNIYDSFTNSSPKVFESAADLHKWAMSTWGGAGMTELTYKRQKLVVYFRSYTSGIATSEPYVFVEKDGRWVRVLTGMMCRCGMEATIEGDALVLWRLDWPNKKKEKTEYLRFNLKTLDAG